MMPLPVDIDDVAEMELLWRWITDIRHRRGLPPDAAPR